MLPENILEFGENKWSTDYDLRTASTDSDDGCSCCSLKALSQQ